MNRLNSIGRRTLARTISSDDVGSRLSLRPGAPRDCGRLLILAVAFAWSVGGGIGAQAQSGRVDPAFYPRARVDDRIESIVVQTDGRAIIGGSFTTVNGQSCPRLARLNPDGSLDPSFGTPLSAESGGVTALALQPDGKLLVGGFTLRPSGSPTRTGIIRLNPNGTWDASFMSGLPGLDGGVSVILTQSNNRILIGGGFTHVHGQDRPYLAQVSANGDLEAGFMAELNGSVRAALVQPDGGIVIGGSFTTIGGESRNHIGRLRTNGVVDPGFLSGLSGADGEVQTVARRSDGTIVIGGEFLNVNDQPFSYLAALRPDGNLAPGFLADSAGPDYLVTKVLMRPDQEILILGGFSRVNGQPKRGLALVTEDAYLQGWYYFYEHDWQFSTMALLPDGKLLVAWIDGSFNFGIARLDNEGTADPSGFSERVGIGDGQPFPDTVLSLGLQPDGRILIGGIFSSIDTHPYGNLARLMPDGSRDVTFASTVLGGNFGRAPYAFAVQDNGRIVLGGSFSSVNGAARNRVARLLADGSLDNTFLNGLSGANGNVRAVQLDASGGILIGGEFTAVNGVNRNCIARLRDDGQNDDRFANAVPPELFDTVATVVTSSGSILIGGSKVNTSTFVATGRVARLLPDGGLDSVFPPTFDGRIEQMVVQPDGRIVVAGSFTAVGGEPRPGVARLLANGTLDGTYAAGTGGPDGYVSRIVLQADGKAVISGGFQYVDGDYRPFVARLNLDGRLDKGYLNSGLGGPDQFVSSLAIQPDGKVLLGGYFQTVDTFGQSKVARLLADPPPPILASFGDRTNAAGSSATCSVVVSNTTTFFYQWLVNGLPVVGANSPSLVLDGLDYNKTIQVQITNLFGGRTLSPLRRLTVVYETGMPLPPPGGADISRLPAAGPSVDPATAARWENQFLVATDPGNIGITWKSANGADIQVGALVLGRLGVGQRIQATVFTNDLRSAAGWYYDEFAIGPLAPADEHAIYLRAPSPGAGLQLSSGLRLTAQELPTVGPDRSLWSIPAGVEGTYSLQVTNRSVGNPGDYDLALYPVVRPLRALAGELAPGDAVTTNRTAAVGTGRWYTDDYLLRGVVADEEVIVRLEGMAFAPFIEARLLFDDTVQQYVEGARLTIRIQGTGQQPRDYLVRVTSGASGATGSYRLVVERQSVNPAVWSFAPPAGLPGTWVTVRGTNFLDGLNPRVTGVRFGDVPAASTEPVDRGAWQEFETQVPEAAATGLITVLTESTAALSTNEFVVLAPIGGLRREGTGVSFAVSNSVAGALNVVETSADLRPPITWTRVATNGLAPAGVWRFTNGNVGALPQRFFRVRRE